MGRRYFDGRNRAMSVCKNKGKEGNTRIRITSTARKLTRERERGGARQGKKSLHKKHARRAYKRTSVRRQKRMENPGGRIIG